MTKDTNEVLADWAKRVDRCTGELRDHFDLGYIVMPVGIVQALEETVADIVGKRYDESGFHKDDPEQRPKGKRVYYERPAIIEGPKAKRCKE